MKKTSIALLIGLIAVGCEAKKPAPAAPADTTKMMQNMASPPGLVQPGAKEEVKEEEKKPEGDAAPAVTEPAPVEEKKE
jgi:hypothetical protein